MVSSLTTLAPQVAVEVEVLQVGHSLEVHQPRVGGLCTEEPQYPKTGDPLEMHQRRRKPRTALKSIDLTVVRSNRITTGKRQEASRQDGARAEKWHGSRGRWCQPMTLGKHQKSGSESFQPYWIEKSPVSVGA